MTILTYRLLYYIIYYYILLYILYIYYLYYYIILLYILYIYYLYYYIIILLYYIIIIIIIKLLNIPHKFAFMTHFNDRIYSYCLGLAHFVYINPPTLSSQHFTLHCCTGNRLAVVIDIFIRSPRA